MPGEQPPWKTGRSRTAEDKSGTLASPNGWGESASPCVSTASGELLEASTWLLQKAAQDEASSGLLWRSEVSWWTGIFLLLWPCTWFSPLANYQVKHSNKSPSPQRQVPLQSQHPNSVEVLHVPEINSCMRAHLVLFPSVSHHFRCSCLFCSIFRWHLWSSCWGGVCLGFLTLLKILEEIPKEDF